MRAWAVVSAVFMAFAWLAGRLFGPFEPWTLKRKLAWTALACLLTVVAFMALYFLDRETWNDSPLQVLLSSSGMALVLLVVSAWCLTVSHVLGWFSATLAGADLRQPDTGGGLP